jgi:hypothetical protein
MSFWIFKIIAFSIIFIFLLHNIIFFLLESLTIYKKKDIFQITNDNYKNIYEVLLNNNNQKNENETTTENLTPINSLPNSISMSLNNADDMKYELTNYLRQQINS